MDNNFKPQPTSKTEIESEGILDKMENQIALARKLENVYDNRPDPKNFIGAMKGSKHENDYTEESVNKDKKYVVDKRKKFDEKNSSNGLQNLEAKENGFALSEMLQAMVVDRINKDWLNEFKAEMTSDYDDLAVGVDAVLKHKEGQYLGASFDFTITKQEVIIEKKLKDNWEYSIEKGEVPTVKYFEDPDTHIKRRITTPKFIIGGTKEDVEDMARAYLNNDEDSLVNHKFQYMIIEQMYEQLVSALDYFDSHKDNTRLDFAKEQYEKVYTVVQRIRDRFSREGKINNLDFFEYKKKSPALETIRQFKYLKEDK